MTLRERIQTDVTTAMRSGDALRRDVLRMAANALYNAEKTARRPLTEDEAIGVLTREVKSRRESVEAFRGGSRPELAEKEEAEIAILAEYLPAALSEAELEALVAQAVAEIGAASPRDLGRVMGWLAPRTRGRADGRHVSELVARALAPGSLAPGSPDAGARAAAPGPAPDPASGAAR